MPVKDIRSKRSRVHASSPCATPFILSFHRATFPSSSSSPASIYRRKTQEREERIPRPSFTFEISLLESFDGLANGTLIPPSLIILFSSSSPARNRKRDLNREDRRESVPIESTDSRAFVVHSSKLRIVLLLEGTSKTEGNKREREEKIEGEKEGGILRAPIYPAAACNDYTLNRNGFFSVAIGAVQVGR